MTVMTERKPHMSVEEFEQFAKSTATQFDSVRLEFIDGRIGIKGMPDGNHTELIGWLQERCMQVRPELRLYSEGQGLRIERYRSGRARPDGSLAPRGTFMDQGEWAEPDGVLMTVEVTSYDKDTNRRDRQEKPVGYAAAGIPVYLLIDRDAHTVVVHSDPDPDSGRYLDIHSVGFGAPVTLPDPVGITLDTETLKNYVR